MNVYSGLNRGGKPWVPQFVEEIKEDDCIGCGRCYKVCAKDVLTMIGISEDGSRVDAQDDDALKKIMTIKHKDNCIGCEACVRTCPKKCFVTEPLPVSA